MLLNRLHLESFRSYGNKTFSFTNNIVAIVGPNTSGKTNILEAIFIGATAKSFRASHEEELINYGKDYSRIGLLVDNEGEKTQLEILLTKGTLYGKRVSSKKYFVNKVPRRMIDFVGRLKVSLFWPEDLSLVINSPSIRRKYLDFVLSQVDREYLRRLRLYEKGIRFRNKLLYRIREGEAKRDELLYWNDLIITNGSYLTTVRKEFIDFINSYVSPIDTKNFKVTYDASEISVKRLEQYGKEEVMAATTLVGPHRDDFIFLLNDKNLSHFGSRGEQRLGVLWLKLGELRYIEDKTKTKPLLLLDDIFSELDYDNRKIVFTCINNHQTFITSAELEYIDKRFIKEAQIISLK